MGPSAHAIKNTRSTSYASADIQVVDLDDQVIQRTTAYSQSQRFGDVFGQSSPVDTVIGSGDVLDVAIWGAARRPLRDDERRLAPCRQLR